MSLRREHITSALRFWEPARLFYNLMLAGVVLVLFGTRVILSPRVGPTLALIGLAAVANLLYSLAYPVDLFLQASDWRDSWRRFGRPLLFLAGTVFAVALLWFGVLGSSGFNLDFGNFEHD